MSMKQASEGEKVAPTQDWSENLPAQTTSLPYPPRSLAQGVRPA